MSVYPTFLLLSVLWTALCDIAGFRWTRSFSDFVVVIGGGFFVITAAGHWLGFAS
jgi:hypothetical protein